jgi:hypothetical protein
MGGGGITALSSQMIADSDFYTGAFPAEYGNALSGVFDLMEGYVGDGEEDFVRSVALDTDRHGLEAAQAFGVGDVVIILIAIDVVLLIGALLQVVGGIRTLAISRAGRTLGIVGCALVIAGWLAFFLYASIQGLSLQGTAWVALVLSVAGSVAALAMLSASGRHFAIRS